MHGRQERGERFHIPGLASLQQNQSVCKSEAKLRFCRPLSAEISLAGGVRRLEPEVAEFKTHQSEFRSPSTRMILHSADCIFYG